MITGWIFPCGALPVRGVGAAGSDAALAAAAFFIANYLFQAFNPACRLRRRTRHDPDPLGSDACLNVSNASAARGRLATRNGSPASRAHQMASPVFWGTLAAETVSTDTGLTRAR